MNARDAMALANLGEALRRHRRTQKRSSSRAHTVCPHCSKRLSGKRGLDTHLAAMHPPARTDAAAEPVSPAP